MFEGITVRLSDAICQCKNRNYNFQIGCLLMKDWYFNVYCYECKAELKTMLPTGSMPYKFEFSNDKKKDKTDVIEELVTILNQ